MNILVPAIKVLLVVLVVLAGVFDTRSRRIPNWLVLAGMLLGLGMNWFLFGLPGLKLAGFGIGAAFLVYFPLFLLRAMGAGDAKLMMAVGAIVGPLNWVAIFVLTALLGGIAGIFVIVAKGAVKNAVMNIGYILHELLWFRLPHQSREELDVTSGKGLSLPHGAVIAGASISYLVIEAIWAPR